MPRITLLFASLHVLLMLVPILMIVKTVADHVESLASVSELLGNRDS